MCNKQENRFHRLNYSNLNFTKISENKHIRNCPCLYFTLFSECLIIEYWFLLLICRFNGHWWLTACISVDFCFRLRSQTNSKSSIHADFLFWKGAGLGTISPPCTCTLGLSFYSLDNLGFHPQYITCMFDFVVDNDVDKSNDSLTLSKRKFAHVHNPKFWIIEAISSLWLYINKAPFFSFSISHIKMTKIKIIVGFMNIITSFQIEFEGGESVVGGLPKLQLVLKLPLLHCLWSTWELGTLPRGHSQHDFFFKGQLRFLESEPLCF